MSDTHENTRNDESLRQKLADKLVGRDRTDERDTRADVTHGDVGSGDAASGDVAPQSGPRHDDTTRRDTVLDERRGPDQGPGGHREQARWDAPVRDDAARDDAARDDAARDDAAHDGGRLGSDRPGAEDRLGGGPAVDPGSRGTAHDPGSRDPGSRDPGSRDPGSRDTVHDTARGGQPDSGVQARDVTSGSIGDAGPRHEQATGTTPGAHDGPGGPGHAASAGTGSAGRDPAPGDGQGGRQGDPALIPQDRSADYLRRWESLKAGFVDEPRAAVRDANQLVGQVLDELEELFRAQRGELERDLGNDEASTEDLRLALGRYRSFFDRLLKI
ncbi:MAG: hypothetical protein OJJ54_16905 [Pseudonocardia sp.]|nr:hypothetical protein [Pseudonocardia sp.]